VAVEGNATFLANSDRVNVPFSSVYPARTSLLGALGDATRNCNPQNPVSVCIDESSFSVDVVSNVSTVEAKFKFHDRGQEGRIQNLTSRLVLHQTDVAAGQAADSTVVAADAAVETTLPMGFDAAELNRWWSLHVQSCERSPVSLAVNFDWVEGARTTQVAWEFTAADLVTKFACDN
jgi:hypothetical protein